MKMNLMKKRKFQSPSRRSALPSTVESQFKPSPLDKDSEEENEFIHDIFRPTEPLKRNSDESSKDSDDNDESKFEAEPEAVSIDLDKLELAVENLKRITEEFQETGVVSSPMSSPDNWSCQVTSYVLNLRLTPPLEILQVQNSWALQPH